MIKIWVLLSVLVLGIVGQLSFADIPESRWHKRFSYRGTPLPLSSPFDELGKGKRAYDFLLYVGRGTWDTGKEHLKWYFKDRGYSYRSVTADQIKKGDLLNLDASILVIPGGESWEYLKELGEAGAREIRQFVSLGGGYLGICAGAFYATSRRDGGFSTGSYGIGLLEGTAYDGTAHETSPFIEGMMDFDFYPQGNFNGLKKQYRSVLFGGPSFRVGQAEKNKKSLQVLSNFQRINEPAMILFEYDRGKVFLSGPHIEIEEELENWGKDFSDPDSEWPILDRVAEALGVS